MAKRTMLNMVQGILSAMDSDVVSSITETEEAMQVSRVIEDTYYDIVDEHDLAHTQDLFALEGLADTDKPTHMKLPQDVSKILWIKYDKRMEAGDPKDYQEVEYLEPKRFIEMCASRDSTDTDNYKVVGYSNNIPIIINKTSPPTWWTSFDDEYIIFDSYYSTLDSTLQTAKTLCYGNMRPPFTSNSDTFVPDLPEQLFGLLYNEAMARSMNLWRQSVLPKVEQAASRMRVRAQRNKWRQDMTHQGVDYGRRR